MMVSNNTDPMETASRVSVDFKKEKGVTTGISAAEVMTVLSLVDLDNKTKMI
jgi:3,4-dihydroxy-2-butanone 4-phosphate synthase